MINDTVGDLTGYELPNIIGMWDGGVTMEDFRTEKVGVGKAMSNLATNTLGNLPFSSGLTLLGVELDGGRIPASSAVPNLSAVWQAATTEGWSSEKRWKDIPDDVLMALVGERGSENLTEEVKAVLWQLQNKSWSWKKNPYDTEVGYEVWQIMNPKK